MRGLGAQYRFDNLYFGAVLNYDWGRDESDDSHLDGMGDVDGTAEGGGFIGYQLGNWRLEVDAMHAIGDSGYDGLEGKVALANIQKFMDDRLIITASVQSSFADHNYMQAYYGVTSEQSITSGYAQYSPSAGFYKAGGTLAAVYSLTPSIAVNGVVGYERLLDHASDSPIVQTGNQYRLGVGISYQF